LRRTLLVLQICLGFFSLACTTLAFLQTVPSITPIPTPSPTESASPSPTRQEPKAIRWLVGINEEALEYKLMAFAETFNRDQAGQYTLSIDTVPYGTGLRDALLLQTASDNPPDIVGPMELDYLWELKDVWLDLSGPLAENGYDLTDFHPALIDTLRLEGSGLASLPLYIHPSALFYNRALFDHAGVPYPPHEWEAEYEGGEWTYAALRDIAFRLTRDSAGRSADSENFNSADIVQFGFYPQWPLDLRGLWTHFGAGSLTDSTGRAVIPDTWRRAARWYYDGMWSGRFIPTVADRAKDEGLWGNPFAYGLTAMYPQNFWMHCCLSDDAPIDWDVAAIPSFEGGRPVSRLHIDSLAILKASEHPQESFDVLTLLMGKYAHELLQTFRMDSGSFGGYVSLPARTSLQPAVIAWNHSIFPDVDYQVFIDALDYADKPSHLKTLPNPARSREILTEFQDLFETTPGLDLDQELNRLEEKLQEAFDAAGSLF
jgi:multiple sugar transport system substrate-binding protein